MTTLNNGAIEIVKEEGDPAKELKIYNILVDCFDEIKEFDKARDP